MEPFCNRVIHQSSVDTDKCKQINLKRRLLVLVHRLAQLCDHIGRVVCAKDRRTRDNNVSAGLRGLVDSAQSESTVDFDVQVGVFFAQSLNLGQFRRHELLTAESRVYSHDQDHLDLLAAYCQTIWAMTTHIRTLLLVCRRKDIPEHINGCIGLNGNTGLHALLVDKPEQLARACRTGSLVGRFSARRRVHSSLVVKAIKIATGFLEFPDPFMRLMVSAH